MLDRTNGKNVLTAPYIEYANWYKGIAANGQPIRDPEKEAMVNGSLTSPTSNGGTGWPNPAFKPDTGLFYVGVTEAFSIFYRTDLDSKPEGYGGLERGGGSILAELRAVDYRTGKIAWRRRTNIGSQSLMTTAGNLLFGSGGSGNFIAFDARVGKPFGHSQLRANPSNSAITYVMDGHQYILVAGGEDYYAFRLQD